MGAMALLTSECACAPPHQILLCLVKQLLLVHLIPLALQCAQLAQLHHHVAQQGGKPEQGGQEGQLAA